MVTNTGLYGAAQNKYVPEIRLRGDRAAIGRALVKEFEDGIPPSGVRPGIIKIGVNSARFPKSMPSS